MTNKLKFLKSTLRSFLITASFSVLATAAYAKGESSAQFNFCPTDVGIGDECVMVFAKVGEAFECSIESELNEAVVDCSVGIGGSGQRCQLPTGMKLDRDSGLIKGVPEKAGFHEFVVLLTSKGVTRERVFLIDIEDSGVNPMKDAYASMFLGAVH